MLNNILKEAATSHLFEEISASDGSIFLQKKVGNSERFLIIKHLTNISPPEIINEEVMRQVPETLTTEPAFGKNCDLVLIHKLSDLADFRFIEEKALEIEEDPFHFKKYFFYYSDAEERAAASKSFIDFRNIITDKAEFNSYKKNPIKGNFYSLAARMYIKLPFLAVPYSKRDLEPLADTVISRTKEEGLHELFLRIAQTDLALDIEKLAKELISEELENIQTKNSGI